MKKTLVLGYDSNYYYYMVLENGECKKKDELQYCDFGLDGSAVIDYLEKEFGAFDFVYWF